MRDEELEEMTDQDVMDKLDESYQAHVLRTDPKWMIVLKELQKERDAALKKLVTVNPKNDTDIVRCQETIRLCAHFTSKIFVGIEKDGELALLEAKERGLVPDTVPDESTKTPTTGA